MVAKTESSSSKSSFVRAFYDVIAQASPARPFLISLNPIVLAMQLGFSIQEGKTLLSELNREGLLSVDSSMNRAFITPKGIKFLQVE